MAEKGAQKGAAGPRRCGFVALVGAPNVGKSTLLNALVGAKVSIVTPKVQTTRSRVTAIAVEGPAQLVFVDTPGIFEPRRRLERAMVAAAWVGAHDADTVVLLVDAKQGLEKDGRRIIAGLKRARAKAVLALNKIDLIARTRLLGLAAELDREGIFARIFMISALSGDGVGDLKDHLAAALPEGPWLYPEDQLADMPERLLAAELTREKLFLALHQELPYATTVETESWTELKDGSLRIEQVIYVRRETQKGIVLGKAGRRVKAIGQASREELQEMLGRRVHLFIFVKVREKWPDDPERYREMGLEFPR
ncbi:MAG: GTPase Era [Alphaproteobacteria bacterium]